MTETDPSDLQRRVAKGLMRTARRCALATRGLADAALGAGAPFASLAAFATLPSGAPIVLISRLAVHTRNLDADPRAALLVEHVDLADPLEGPRVTLMGRLEAIPADLTALARRRFLARHPSAAGYVDFNDFSFRRLELAGGHLVAGFGRINAFTPAELLTALDGASDLIEAEPSAIAHLNADHRDSLALYATKLCGAADGDWQATGLDPEGLDLATRDMTRTVRVSFPDRVTSAAGLRTVLRTLAETARGE